MLSKTFFNDARFYTATDRMSCNQRDLPPDTSDGDRQMLEWTAAGTGARFVGLVHHTDAEREYAYDRRSTVGKLDKAWDEAMQHGWVVVDIKAEWQTIYPFQR